MNPAFAGRLRILPVLLALGAASAPAEDLCQGLVQDRSPRPLAPLVKPALGQAVADPQFGATLRRITAVAPAPGRDPVIKPMYSTMSAWNADETLLILYQVGVGHRLHDGRTYAFLRALPIAPNDLEQVFWHTTDPDVLFYPSGSALMRYRVSTGIPEMAHAFDCPGPVTFDSHGYMAWDSRVLGLRCAARDSDFIFRLDTGVVTGSRRSSRPAPIVGASGRLAFWQGDVVDSEMTVERRLDLANPTEHASLGRLANGLDTYNAVAFDPGPGGSGVGTLVTTELDSGRARVVIGPSTGWPYPPGGTHVSAVAHEQPGWVYASVIGDPAGRGVLDQEIVLADTNTGRVCRVAHHRSWGRRNTHLGDGYWAEPHVVASPSGTRALFASDWGGGATVDTYVVELPSHARPTVSVSAAAPDHVAGSRLELALRVTSPGTSGRADLLFLMIRPDGDEVLALTPAGWVAGRLSSPSGLAALAAGVGLSQAWRVNLPAFLSFTWSGQEAPGAYTWVVALVAAGALADDTIDAGDVLTSSAVTTTFQP